MAQTACVGFVVGGKILDRSLPDILKPNPARRNQRTMTEEEWGQFCLDVEASMGWENHWRNLLSKPVIVSSILTLLSFGMLIAWSTLPLRRRGHLEAHQSHDAYENHPREDEFPINSHRYNYTRGSYNYATQHGSVSRVDFFMENFLPDICVMLILITFVSMTISIIQVSLNLQESVKKVCEDYTKCFLPFHGISFSVEQKEVPTSHISANNNHQQQTLASPSSRSTSVLLRHSRHGAHATMARKNIRPCILIRKYDSEETSSAKSHQANSTNLLIPSYQLSAAPFFDVPKPIASTLLLPPPNRFAGVLVPQTLAEK